MKIKFTKSNPVRVKILSVTLASLIILAIALEIFLY